MSEAERYTRAEIMLPGVPCVERASLHDEPSERAKKAAVQACNACIQAPNCQRQIGVFKTQMQIEDSAIVGGVEITPSPNAPLLAGTPVYFSPGRLPEDETLLPRYFRMLYQNPANHEMEPTETQRQVSLLLAESALEEIVPTDRTLIETITTLYAEITRLFSSKESIPISAVRFAAQAITADIQTHRNIGQSPEEALKSALAYTPRRENKEAAELTLVGPAKTNRLAMRRREKAQLVAAINRDAVVSDAEITALIKEQVGNIVWITYISGEYQPRYFGGRFASIKSQYRGWLLNEVRSGEKQRLLEATDLEQVLTTEILLAITPSGMLSRAPGAMLEIAGATRELAFAERVAAMRRAHTLVERKILLIASELNDESERWLYLNPALLGLSEKEFNLVQNACQLTNSGTGRSLSAELLAKAETLVNPDFPPLPEDPAEALQVLRAVPDIFADQGQKGSERQLITATGIKENKLDDEAAAMLNRLVAAISRYGARAHMSEVDCTAQLAALWPRLLSELQALKRSASPEVENRGLLCLRLGNAYISQTLTEFSNDPNIAPNDIKRAFLAEDPGATLRTFSACVDALEDGEDYREVRRSLTARKRAARAEDPEAEIAAIGKRLEDLMRTYGQKRFVLPHILRYYCFLHGEQAASAVDGFLARCALVAPDFPTASDKAVANAARKFTNIQRIRHQLQVGETVANQSRPSKPRRSVKLTNANEKLSSLLEVSDDIAPTIINEVFRRIPDQTESDIRGISTIYQKLIDYGVPRTKQASIELKSPAERERMLAILQKLTDLEFYALVIAGGLPHVAISKGNSPQYLEAFFNTSNLSNYMGRLLQERMGTTENK